jgi:short-chain fatty acids transporter
LFVPSSGGIFATQGPIMLRAGAELGIPAATVVNTFSSGEVISNMIQPFWAIPMLSLVGLKISDIIGYCLISFFIVSIVFCSYYYIIF